MEAANESYYSLTEISKSIRAFFRFTLRRWYLLLLVMAIAAFIGTVFYYRQKPSYEAETTFILEEKSSMGGGLSGIASQFGIDMGAIGGGGSLFAGDNILDILKSKKIIYKVLLTKVGEGEQPGETLADLFVDFTGWKKNWVKNETLNKIDFTQVADEDHLTSRQDSILNEIHEYLVNKAISVERYNKKGSIIRVEVTSSNSIFSRHMTTRLVDEAAKLYLQIKTGTAQANIAKMQRRSDSLLVLLNRKSYASAASVPLDVNPGIQTLVVPAEIATRDKTVLATLYAEVTKNLEAGKLLLSQQTPVIQLLDRPGMLLKDKRRSLPFFVVVAIIAAGFIYMLVNLFVFIYTTTIKQKKSLKLG